MIVEVQYEYFGLNGIWLFHESLSIRTAFSEIVNVSWKGEMYGVRIENGKSESDYKFEQIWIGQRGVSSFWASSFSDDKWNVFWLSQTGGGIIPYFVDPSLKILSLNGP